MSDKRVKKEPRVRLAPEGGWPKGPRSVAASDVPVAKQPRQRTFVAQESDGKVVIQLFAF